MAYLLLIFFTGLIIYGIKEEKGLGYKKTPIFKG